MSMRIRATKVQALLLLLLQQRLEIVEGVQRVVRILMHNVIAFLLVYMCIDQHQLNIECLPVVSNRLCLVLNLVRYAFIAASRMMVYRWLQLQLDEAKHLSASSPLPKKRRNKTIAPRHLVWRLLKDPKELGRRERQTLLLLKQEPAIERAYDLAQQFVTMIKERNIQPLAAWLQACSTSDISDLASFAQGLERGSSPADGFEPSLQQWARGGNRQQAQIYQAPHVWSGRISTSPSKSPKVLLKEHEKWRRPKDLTYSFLRA